MKLTKKARIKLAEQFVDLLYRASWEKEKYNSLMNDLIELLMNEPYKSIVNSIGEMSTQQQAKCLFELLKKEN